MMKEHGTIYLVTNTINDKVYVGQTTQKLSARISQHKTKLTDAPFSRAIQKYGFENFTFIELISTESQEELDNFELEIIREYDSMLPNGYNIQSGGNLSYERCKEYRVYISEAMKGNQNAKGKTRTISQNIENSKRQRKSSWDHIIATNIITGEEIRLDTIKSGESHGLDPKKISRIINTNPSYTHCGHSFTPVSYDNPSGSSETKDSEHAQRLEIEPISFRTLAKYKKILCVDTGIVFSNKAELELSGYKWTNVRPVLQGKRKSSFGQVFKFVD